MRNKGTFILLALLGLICPTAGFAQICASPVCIPAPAGILSWYPGDDNTHDITGLNHGFLEGTATFAPGKVGPAFRFNRNPDDYVDQNVAVNLGNVADFDFAPTDSFSIEAWVNVFKFSVLPEDGEVVVCLNCGGQFTSIPLTGQTLAIQDTGKPFFQVRDISGVTGLAIASSPLSLNAWHHLVGVREGLTGVVKLYVNGTLVASVPGPSTGQLANTVPDYIGRRVTNGTNNPFNGLIDEVTIYNRALSNTDVRTQFLAGSLGKCKTMVCQ